MLISIILVLVILIGAFGLLGWNDIYHITLGMVALLGLIPFMIKWQRRKKATAKRRIRLRRKPGMPYYLVRGVFIGLLLPCYLALIFQFGVWTGINRLFLDCDAVMERIGLYQQDENWTRVIELIDSIHTYTSTTDDCECRLAKEKIWALVKSTYGMPDLKGVDSILTLAKYIAEEYGLEKEALLINERINAVFADRIELQAGTKGIIHQYDKRHPYLSVYFSLLDPSGKAIKDLSNVDIVLQENGRRIDDFNLCSFRSDPEPLSIAICVDASGSVKNNIEQIKNGVSVFVGLLSENDSYELIFFNDKVERILGWTEVKDELLDPINSLRAKGNTALYDALEVAYEDLKKQNGRKSILIFTDGKDEGSKTGYDDIYVKLKDSNIPIYTIGLESPGLDRTSMEKIAHESGGIFIEAEQPHKIVQAYQNIADKLNSIFRLEYKTKSKPGSKIDLSITVGCGQPVTMYKQIG